jgi:predicted flap endonuclease-1-like 5' DNA nuclease
MRREITDSLSVLEGELARLERLFTQLSASDEQSARHVGEARDLASRAHAELTTAVRLYEAHQPAASAPTRLGDRIVLIETRTISETFRTKVKLKTIEASAPPETAAASAAPAAPRGDDLTRIRGIDASLTERLARHDVTTFATIAAWGQDDVRRISAALDLGRQISRQNWIEQAALLAGAAARPAASAPASATAADRSVGAAPPAMQAAPPPAEADAAVTEPVPPDRLQLIRGIDAAVAAALHDNGVSRWSQIAGWRRADIERLSRKLGLGARIAKECWIEQAAMLASGRISHHATRQAAGDYDCIVPSPAVEMLAEPEFVDWQAARSLAPPKSIVAAPATEDEPQQEMPDEALVLIEVPADARPPAPRSHAMPPIAANDTHADVHAASIDRISDLEAEMAVFVSTLLAANDAPVEPVPATALPALGKALAARHSTLHIEDEEFPELHIDEADVVIVARPAAKAPSPAESHHPSDSTRSLLSRLRHTAPIGDIDSRTYAAYRDQVDEATVEIIKPSAGEGS